MTTGFVWAERYMWHDTSRGSAGAGWMEPGTSYAEHPATKRRLRNLLEVSGLLERMPAIAPRAATVEELCRFHTRAYVERIAELSAGDGGDAGEVAPFGPGSYEIARLSAGGVIAAVDAVLDGTVDNAYALVRPPGHHALADRGMGFCIFGNVAVAVLHARRARGVARVAVVDWDVHHGNGTQAAFYDDPTVLTISIHQERVFPPGSGPISERGTGAGEGFNINVPLPAGSSTGAYAATMERVVLPALRAFAPDLIVVACGFDASLVDPLGRMMLRAEDYFRMTEQVRDAAAELCDGKLVLAHEGGYSELYVPFCGVAAIEALIGGERSGVVDLYAAVDGPEHALQPAQDAVVAAAERIVPRAAG